MAAPIRIRVAELRAKFGNCPPLNEFVDPFWLLVSVKELPFIHDVGKRVLSACINAISRQAKDDSDFEDCSSMLTALASDSDAGSGTSNALCELWLDGCRLLDSERTDVLRDNDSIAVTVLNYERRKRKRPKTVDHDDLEFSNVRKKKKDKDLKKKKESVEVSCDDKVSNSTNKHLAQMNDILPPGMISTPNVEEKAVDHKCSLNSFQLVPESIPDSVSLNDKKKKKKKREKETSDIISDKKKRKPNLTVSFNDSVSSQGAREIGINPVQSDGIQSVLSPSLSNISEIELQKRKLLGQLDSFVQSGELLQVAENSGDCLKNSQNDDHDTTSLGSKRRRRRKKKSKAKEESKPILRVEDKPRSSVLNLPWDMQPQSRKITFDSDSDDATQEDIVGDGAKLKVNDKTVDTSGEDKKELGWKSNEDVKKNDKNSLESQSVSKRYKDLTPTCRKYLMRSTVGILDSLRTGSDTSNNHSFPHDPPVTTKCGRESSSIASDINRPMRPTVDTARTKESPLQSRIDDVAVEKPNREFKSTFVKSTHHQTSGINSEGKFNQHRKADSSPISNFEKTGVSSSSPSKSVDYDAKFNELLQRRKLSSTQCSVSRSENGVTICSRNKSPKWSPYAQVNKFTDPAADVLTNVSTVKKFGRKDESFNFPQKLTTSGRNFVKGTVNGGSGDTKVEVMPLDIENCPSLSGKPCMGDILAYKILEMDADYTPVVSDFKTGKVLSCEGGFIMLELFGSPASKKPKGKFDLVYDDDEEESTQDTQIAEQVNVDLASMMDTRLVQRYTENGT